jgi:hypothetical protein
MTGRFPPLGRMGGKRSYADHVLETLGWYQWADRPTEWLMVDADPAIVEFWAAAFAGALPVVAEVIRSAPLDGEELWRAWKDEPVPADPVERLARWIVLQKGNFSGKPLTWKGGGPKELAWHNFGGYRTQFPAAIAAGFPRDSFTAAGTADKVTTIRGPGAALRLDLAVECPEIAPGDLVTLDPPYRGTTAYGPKLGRERVVELALQAHDSGAKVLVHEAEPILTHVDPWRSVELHRRHQRKARAWSKQRHEMVTLNFEPAGQAGLW